MCIESANLGKDVEQIGKLFIRLVFLIPMASRGITIADLHLSGMSSKIDIPEFHEGRIFCSTNLMNCSITLFQIKKT
jgi:hypothetical protein